MCVLSPSILSSSLWPYGLQPTRLLGLSDFPSKNTGIGSHFFLQGIFPTQWSNLTQVSCIAGRFFSAEPLGSYRLEIISLRILFSSFQCLREPIRFLILCLRFSIFLGQHYCPIGISADPYMLATYVILNFLVAPLKHFFKKQMKFDILFHQMYPEYYHLNNNNIKHNAFYSLFV